MEIKLRRHWKQYRRDIGASLDEKNIYRSSLKKLDPSVCQTGVSDFHRKNLYSNDFPKMI
jgi:hypothetical protein